MECRTLSLRMTGLDIKSSRSNIGGTKDWALTTLEGLARNRTSTAWVTEIAAKASMKMLDSHGPRAPTKETREMCTGCTVRFVRLGRF